MKDEVVRKIIYELYVMPLEKLERLLPGFYDECEVVTDEAKQWFEDTVRQMIEFKRQQATT